MSPQQKIRVALVGAGAAGQAHAFGFRNVSMASGLDTVQIDLAVVVDPNVELARRTAARYGYAEATADLQKVLDDPTIDAISVALPNSVHADVLPAILRSGKHVLTEKPIGRGSAEATELVALAEQSPAVTGVGFSFRRLPGLAAVHDLVADGAIGTVHNFTAWYNADYGSSPQTPFSWRYAKDTAGAGALIDIGTHAIDTVQYVVGPIRRVLSATLRTAIDRRPVPGTGESAVVDTDDIALLTVELESGAVGQIRVNRIATGIPNSLGIEVHGSEGHARFDSIAAGEFHVHIAEGPAALSGPRRVFTSPAHPYFSDVAAMPGGGVGTGYAEAFVAEIQHFVRCILARTPMDTGFPSAYRVMLTVDAAQRAAETGTAVSLDEVDTTLALSSSPAPA
ncbi:Gfo/Idh/MocA family oxidoreductase [Rhodococcus pseudokoreensis]|uniref:Gfo/Idh/MocA family oxidoreductase n=1 Tax=Rhodococcus pseudokoreensis TaxID=2811421 RepID=A0A974ZYF3_9NOCA|nr:Gfo/Idh/MocA family oxidoreductase [Rhodococcus pseudokoreensis]QSE95049.1 Gfo/Idh/MocA family oxidoreductase [Rhodococcus pseudokoreensis]